MQSVFDPAAALALMEAERITFPSAMPHQWAQMEQSPAWENADLSSLRYVDTTPAAGRHPTVATDWVQPTALYGGTEMFTVAVAFFGIDTPADEVAGSSGRPLPGNRIKIVDPESGEILPRGERGEIALNGPTRLCGYAGVSSDDTLDADGYYRSGDGGYIDDRDRLFWEGRIAEVIKSGGANVSPLEIDVVLGTHPAVKLCKTVGVPDPLLGEIVVSCVVPREAAQFDEAAVRAHVAERLASYKVPRRIVLLREDELPLTSTAKIKANELRDIAARRIAEIV